MNLMRIEFGRRLSVQLIGMRKQDENSGCNGDQGIKVLFSGFIKSENLPRFIFLEDSRLGKRSDLSI
jgi:hypothetical protein